MINYVCKAVKQFIYCLQEFCKQFFPATKSPHKYQYIFETVENYWQVKGHFPKRLQSFHSKKNKENPIKNSFKSNIGCWLLVRLEKYSNQTSCWVFNVELERLLFPNFIISTTKNKTKNKKASETFFPPIFSLSGN